MTGPLLGATASPPTALRDSRLHTPAGDVALAWLAALQAAAATPSVSPAPASGESGDSSAAPPEAVARGATTHSAGSTRLGARRGSPERSRLAGGAYQQPTRQPPAIRRQQQPAQPVPAAGGASAHTTSPPPSVAQSAPVSTRQSVPAPALPGTATGAPARPRPAAASSSGRPPTVAIPGHNSDLRAAAASPTAPATAAPSVDGNATRSATAQRIAVATSGAAGHGAQPMVPRPGPAANSQAPAASASLPAASDRLAAATTTAVTRAPVPATPTAQAIPDRRATGTADATKADPTAPAAAAGNPKAKPAPQPNVPPADFAKPTSTRPPTRLAGGKIIAQNTQHRAGNPTQTSAGDWSMAAPGGPLGLAIGPSAAANYGNPPVNLTQSAGAAGAPMDARSLNAMGAQLHALHQAGGGHANLQLDPPSLGSVHIQLHLAASNQAQVMFTASQPATVQVLQANLAQLAAVLHQNGIHLVHSEVNASVTANLPDQSGQQGHPQGFTGEQFSARPTGGSATAAPAPKARHNPGVRAYA